ncbi:MAG TPA: YceI family protein [Thermoanaerobaculia bacterium]|nr:YceI family protein [Thermoanaerobaculia bacterium]
MKRLLLLLFFATNVAAAPARYLVRPVYSNVGFSIVKWGVLKEEGVFRDFAGTLDYDPAAPERSRIDVVVRSASLDTKEEHRDGVVRSDDFLDAARYPTMEFHSTGVRNGVVTGNLTIHGVTRRVQFRPAFLGIRDLPKIGKLAGFETTFAINRRDYGVLGSKWGAVPGVLSDEVMVHIIVGAVAR